MLDKLKDLPLATAAAFAVMEISIFVARVTEQATALNRQAKN